MIERIDLNWPREPDTEGYPEDFVQTVLDRRLPFDEEDPLVFHVLTTLGDFEAGEQDLKKVMAEGASLLPRSWADKRWGDEKSLIFARDVVAGDDNWLFTTPCNVFSGYHDRSKYNPAVCFHLSTVMRYAKKLAFRVHDLEPQYRLAEEMAGEPDLYDDEDYDFDEDMDDQDYRYDLGKAANVSEQIEAIAEVGTQTDAEAAVELTRLYARLCSAFRKTPHAFVRRDDPERLEIYESAYEFFPEVVQKFLYDDRDISEWLQDVFVDEIADQLVGNWKELFFAPDTPDPMAFPWILLVREGPERPELLVQGEIPLCEAAFYRDASQAWKPVGKTICKNGLSAFHRRR